MSQVIEQIYREHRQGLFSLALSITGSHHMAEDVVHNAFAKLFGNRIPDSNSDELSDSVAYAFKTVRNTAIDSIRKRQRQRRFSEPLFELAEKLTSNHPTSNDTLIQQEQATALQSAIDELTEGEREAVLLKAIAGLTFDQVGHVVNTSPKTIATRYRRALQKLAQKLKGQI